MFQKFCCLTLSVLCLVALNVSAQKSKKKKTQQPAEFSLAVEEPAAHLKFLASDEMLGRRTGEITNNVAARYIAEQFRRFGLQTAPGQADFLQAVSLEKVKPSAEGRLVAGKDTFLVKKHFIALAGEGLTLNNLPVVFAGYGMTEDYKDLDVKGKIVVGQFGTVDAKSPMQGFDSSERKRKIADSLGVAVFIETLPPTLPWQSVVRFFAGERVRVAGDKEDGDTKMPHLWVGGTAVKTFNRDNVKNLSGVTPGLSKEAVRSSNVVGMLEGSDATLKNEFVVVSAHFDHVGTGKNGGGNFTAADSIFNGTRDNAFGSAALLTAARIFAQERPKRSVLFIGFTGEELGLLGSKYYASHPLIPMEKCVFNLNTDGAGYNDTTKVTIFGLERTGAKAQIEAAAAAFGLTVNEDPAPEQGLFDRSDNVSFAAKGVPAPTFSPGFTKFDDSIYKYYHQVTDNPNTISYGYFLKYVQVLVHTARLVADRPDRPQWAKGDKYEPAAIKLYGTK